MNLYPYLKPVLRIGQFIENHFWFLVPGATSPKIISMKESLSSLAYEKAMLEIDIRSLKRELEWEKKDHKYWEEEARREREKVRRADNENHKLTENLGSPCL